MKRVQKEKIISSTIFNVLLSIGVAILLYVIVNGYNRIPNIPTRDFVMFTGAVLVILSLISLILAYKSKKALFMKYSALALGLGALMLVLHYSYFKTIYGQYVYYSLLALSGLYAIGAITYSVVRLRRG